MLINKNLIMLDLKAKNKNESILELAKLAQKEGKVISIDDYVESVMNREKSYSTGVGNGIAIPHGKSKSVKEAVIVFGRLNQGIEWDSIDGELVNIIFLLGIPEENVENIHLKVLSQLSRKLMYDDFTDFLKNANTEDEILKVLNDIEI